MKSKTTLILLFAVFFAPIVVALLLNSQWLDWRAVPARAHGELLQPVVPIGAFELPDAAGQTRTSADLTGRWQLVFTTAEACGEDCRETLALLHNVRLAQDRRAADAALLLITDRVLDSALVEQLQRSDTTWTVFDGAAGAALRARFPDPDPRAYYIVDPEANIIERFGPDADLTGIRKDFDRLLTWTLRD
ncbi:MAG: hypothetical protein CVV18_05525 [Gammaproteobacteria bacterium HGW-Gammaproteobacteria-8]|nr:MAG: hypothetical protein CVV18_05525 [Gammaproteobacteria bacterium HGW-Gammaproteobacteria-8]